MNADGGATAFSTLTAPPDSGDDGDGVLEPGETWRYVVQTTESADVTVTATAFGTAPSGLVVTFPGDAEAQVAAAVVVAAAPTTTTTSTTSTTVPGSSTTTSDASTTSSGEVAAGTLPFTGAGGLGRFSVLAVGLVALGLTTLVLARRSAQEE